MSPVTTEILLRLILIPMAFLADPSGKCEDSHANVSFALNISCRSEWANHAITSHDFKNIVQCAKYLWRNEGPRGYVAGKY